MKLRSTIVMVAPVLALSGGFAAHSAADAPVATTQIESVVDAKARSDAGAPAGSSEDLQSANLQSDNLQVVEIAITGGEFVPSTVAIAAGGTVVWTNEDKMVHTATAPDGSWDSGEIQPGGSWRHRFDEPGEYTFVCVPHPGMSGTVVVRRK